MRRMHVKRKLAIKLSSKIVIILFLVIFLLIYLYITISKNVTPLLISYAEMYSKRKSNELVSNALKELNYNVDKLYNIDSNNDNIKEINFNTYEVNNYLADLNLCIIKKLDNIDNIVYEVPLKVIYNNPFISNLGSKIPIKINFVDSITSNIKTKINNYGINNALIEVYASVVLEEAVILPFKTKNIKVEINVPLLIKVINGSIPNYYSGIESGSTKFSLPIK